MWGPWPDSPRHAQRVKGSRGAAQTRGLSLHSALKRERVIPFARLPAEAARRGDGR
jgi:hypothetical protein